jgi:hypothetical protein
MLSEIAKESSDLGSLARNAERVRPYAELDRSFFWEKPAEDAARPSHITCRNEALAGKRHPLTDVPFERRAEWIDGRPLEVVVPRFERVYEADLPAEDRLESDARQFRTCNDRLREAVDADPGLRAKFTGEQLEQIRNGDTPDGWVWHHDARPGRMQLVDEMTHMRTSHTGGRALWGGGAEYR